MRRWAPIVMLLAASCIAAACGIPSDGTAHPLPAGAIPSVIPPTTAATIPASPGSEGGVIFLSDGDQLVAVATLDPVTSPTAALTDLLQWPQRASGRYRSAINERTRLLAPVYVEGGVAIVSLSAEFVDVAARQELIAVAQVVFTATAVAGVRAVRFVVDGNALEVPRGDGRLVTRPVGRDDYPRLLAGSDGSPASP